MGRNSLIQTGEAVFEAGEEKTVNMPGNVFVLKKTAFPVDIVFQTAENAVVGNVSGATGFKVRMPELAAPSQVLIKSSAAQVVRWSVSSDDVEFYEPTETTVQQATVLTMLEPVTVGTGPAVLIAPADASRRRLIVRADPDNVGIVGLGGEGVTMENAAILLDDEGSIVDGDAAAAAWYAIADTVDQKVRMMGAS